MWLTIVLSHPGINTNIRNMHCWNKACTPTEVATLLSHVRAIRKAFHDGHEFALVAEDDVDFSLYDDNALRKIVASLPREWGSLQLYTGHFRVVEWMIKTFPPYTALPRNGKELRSSNAWSNACVLYSRRGKFFWTKSITGFCMFKILKY